jgi:hypothetical protein
MFGLITSAAGPVGGLHGSAIASGVLLLAGAVIAGLRVRPARS